MSRRTSSSVLLLLAVVCFAVVLAQPASAAVALTLDDMARVKGGWICANIRCGGASHVCTWDYCNPEEGKLCPLDRTNSNVQDCGNYLSGTACLTGVAVECGRDSHCNCYGYICFWATTDTIYYRSPCLKP